MSALTSNTSDIFSLSNRVALITGGAYGIGFAIAKAMAHAGATIVFNCTQQSTFHRAIDSYRQTGIEANGYICDVTDESSVQAMVADIKTRFGSVDILVNNAGIINRTPMLQMPTTDFRRVVDVDLVGPFICAKAVIPDMIENRRGKIINICSLMSKFGREDVSAYAAAKGGLRMLTRNICAEYGQYNIQCNGIAPGYIATPQTEPLRRRDANGRQNTFDRFVISRTPAQRWGTPDDIAGTALFLASDASNYVNGQIIYVDGGFSASIGRPN